MGNFNVNKVWNIAIYLISNLVKYIIITYIELAQDVYMIVCTTCESLMSVQFCSCDQWVSPDGSFSLFHYCDAFSFIQKIFLAANISFGFQPVLVTK